MIIHAAVPSAGWSSVGGVVSATHPCSTCRHPMTAHQTGEGPFTGWCYQDDCDCEWPMIDVVEQLALDHKIPVARLQELVSATRDIDGWPVGLDGHPVGPLTEMESSAVQAYDDGLTRAVVESKEV